MGSVKHPAVNMRDTGLGRLWDIFWGKIIPSDNHFASTTGRRRMDTMRYGRRRRSEYNIGSGMALRRLGFH